MTVAEFLDWEGDGTASPHELVDGEVRAMAPASITHGLIQAAISGILRNHLAGTDCHVVIAPGVIPQVLAAENLRIPDLAVNCSADEVGQRSLPDPILIIEILSPSNEAETRDNVWAYTTIPSVREILLLRSTEIAAELLRRQTDGNWPARPELIAAADDLHLAIDYRGPLRGFYEDTHLARTGG